MAVGRFRGSGGLTLGGWACSGTGSIAVAKSSPMARPKWVAVWARLFASAGSGVVHVPLAKPKDMEDTSFCPVFWFYRFYLGCLRRFPSVSSLFLQLCGIPSRNQSPLPRLRHLAHFARFRFVGRDCPPFTRRKTASEEVRSSVFPKMHQKTLDRLLFSLPLLRTMGRIVWYATKPSAGCSHGLVGVFQAA